LIPVIYQKNFRC